MRRQQANCPGGAGTRAERENATSATTPSRNTSPRGMLTQDRSEKEQDEYLRKLRQEAFIKPAPNYGEVIQPLLDKDKSWQQTAATHHPAIWQRSGYVVADWINSIQTRSRFLSVRTLG